MPHGFTPPMRVAEKVATADILSGGRVEWGTGRSTPMEQTAFGVDRGERHATSGKRRSRPSSACGKTEYFEFHGKYLDFPRRMVTPKPVQDPHPPCWMAATSRRQRGRSPGSSASACLSFSIMQPIEKMAKHIAAVPRGGDEPQADHPRHHEQGGGVHARALRRVDGAGRGERHLGLGVVVVQEPRRVHARVGVPALPAGRARRRSSRCSSEQARGRPRPEGVQRRRHDHRGRPRAVPREDAASTQSSASTSSSATCSSATCARSRSWRRSSCSAPRSSRSSSGETRSSRRRHPSTAPR